MDPLRKFFWKYDFKLAPYRDKTFYAALKIAHFRKSKIFVETGTTRKIEIDHHGDGASTVIFADFCNTFCPDGHIWTCDIEEKNIEICKEVTKEYQERIDYVVDDSLNFLSNFDKPIDFLYLDSFDASNGLDEEASQHNLEEVKIVLEKLHDNSIILIDDCNVGTSISQIKGKGIYSVPFLIDNGWRLLNDSGGQAIFIKAKK
jgi:predicted O-methyltransferase YrrM